MSDKNLIIENKRLNEIIKAVERQRNEALAARAHGDATAALLQEALRESQAALTAAKAEIEALKAAGGKTDAADDKPAKKAKNAV